MKATLLVIVLGAISSSATDDQVAHQMNFSLVPNDKTRMVDCQFLSAVDVDMSTLKMTVTTLKPSGKFVERACALLTSYPLRSWKYLRGPEQYFVFWSPRTPDVPASAPEGVR